VNRAEVHENGNRSAAGNTYRPVTAAMRAILWVGVVLVLVAGTSLYVLTDHTDRYFAWTIKVPLSAAFLGAFYYTACVIAVLSVRRRQWARARVGVPGVTAFLWLTMLATLLHLDLFHLSSGTGTARAAAWLWLFIYVVDPIALTVILLLQLREPGGDPPRTTSLPGWYRGLVVIEGVLLVVVGVALFVAPSTATHLWPWPLTPLTARMTAAWLVGLGITMVCASFENDWDRIRPASAGLVALVLLQAIVLARYASHVTWATPRAQGYAVLLGLNLVLGIVGLAASAGTRVGGPAP
jgi:hypothetical protein